jgi:hypothetical protein
MAKTFADVGDELLASDDEAYWSIITLSSFNADGIVCGLGEGSMASFGVDAVLSRGQMAKVLCRAAGYCPGQLCL